MHLDTVRREFVVPVSGHPYVAVCHEHPYRVEGPAQRLRAFVVADLSIYLVRVSTHVRPDVREIFRA